MLHFALVQRTPAPIVRLENFEPDFPPMLDYSILAIIATIAQGIAFIDVVSALDKGISQTFRVQFGL